MPDPTTLAELREAALALKWNDPMDPMCRDHDIGIDECLSLITAYEQSAKERAKALAEELKEMIAEECGITGGSMHNRINKLAALAAGEQK